MFACITCSKPHGPTMSYPSICKGPRWPTWQRWRCHMFWEDEFQVTKNADQPGKMPMFKGWNVDPKFEIVLVLWVQKSHWYAIGGTNVAMFASLIKKHCQGPVRWAASLSWSLVFALGIGAGLLPRTAITSSTCNDCGTFLGGNDELDARDSLPCKRYVFQTYVGTQQIGWLLRNNCACMMMT